MRLYFSTLKISWWQSKLLVDIFLCGKDSELVHSTYRCIWIFFWLYRYVRKILLLQDDSCFIRLMASKSGTSQINKYSQTIQIFIRQSGFKGWIMLPAFLVLEIRHYQYGSTNILHYQYGSTKTYLCLFRGKFSGSSNISSSFYFQFFNHVDRILKVRKQLSSCLLLSSTLTKTVLFFYESYHVTDNTVM